MYKLSHRVAEAWVEHSFAPTFSRMPTTSGGQVLLVGVPAGDNMVMMKLLECVEAPFFLLYVLHSPRGEAEPGRYQSPRLSLAEVHAFIMRFSHLLSNDARQDFW